MRKTFGITLTPPPSSSVVRASPTPPHPARRSPHQLRRRWPQTPRITTVTRTGLWGLAGLVSLLGLAGLKRRNDTNDARFGQDNLETRA